MSHKKAIVIGAGIVGLAIARSLAKRNYKVIVFEKNKKAIGASIRNFGMIWPIGQPNGVLYERALKAKSIWKEICVEARLWFHECGSLHVAHHPLEWQVLQETMSAHHTIRPVTLLNAQDTLKKSSIVNESGLMGSLFCADEMIVESRVAIEQLPNYFQEKYGMEFHFQTAISSIQFPKVYSGKQQWAADEIYVCSGADLEVLYPDVYALQPITKCKLQMMRFEQQPHIQVALCGGLSLIHYSSFEVAPSLPLLRNYFEHSLPEYVSNGIHVMLSQNETGEITVGDSHEYGAVHEPFDKTYINELIINYLKKIAALQSWKTIQTWNGTYAKLTNKQPAFTHQPESGVTLVNGLGGAGMTLSFALAEDIVEKGKL
jgi:FAD dependent oxidoreductase TIGR03364